MGWRSAPDASGIEVGDEVLDRARHFLVDFSRAYQRDLNRKPTLAELEYAIGLAFKTNADDRVLADFDELEIRQVAIKTGKRPKRIKVKSGDIFAFRLDEDRFGFGRVVSLVSIGAVVEIFDCFSSQPIFDHSKIDDWLMPPTTIGTHALFKARAEGDWRVVAETRDFAPGPKYQELRFVYGDGDDGFLTAVDVLDRESKVSPGEAAGYPFYSIRGDRDVRELVAEALNKARR